MNASDVLINASSGCVLAFAGTWLISLVRSVKLLDDDRAAEILAADEQVKQLTTRISEKDKNIVGLQEAYARKHPHDEHKDQLVHNAFSKLDERDREFLKWLLDI